MYKNNLINFFKKLFLNKTFQILLFFLIFIVGFILRLWHSVKIQGLWYDEAYSFYVAKESFPMGILHRLFSEDYHAPLYYFILHFWMDIFGKGDFVLRFFSVISGGLSIVAAYFCGKELVSRRTGIIASSLFAVNSLLIYYSQEVRFYSLSVLFATLALLFLIKLKNKPSKLNYAGLIISNLCLMYTFVIGFILVSLQAVAFGVYLYYKNREKLKTFIYLQIFTFILFLPYFIPLVYKLTQMTKLFVGSYEWINFNLSGVYIVFQNMFSPILMNLYNNNVQFYFGEILRQLLINPLTTLFFILLPVIIAVIALSRVIKEKNEFLYVIFSYPVLFIILEIIATLMGKFGFLSRYVLVCVPALLVVIAYGLTRINNSKIGNSLFASLIAVNLFFLVVFPVSAPKTPRVEGLMQLNPILKKYSANNQDMIIMPYGGKLFDEYCNYYNVKVMDFNILDGLLYTPEKAKAYLPDNILANITKQNSHDLLKSYLALNEPSLPIENYIKNNAYNRLKKGKYFFVIYGSIMNGFDNQQDKNYLINSDNYYKVPVTYLLTAKVSDDILNLAFNNFKTVAYEECPSWKIYVFQKK